LLYCTQVHGLLIRLPERTPGFGCMNMLYTDLQVRGASCLVCYQSSSRGLCMLD